MKLSLFVNMNELSVKMGNGLEERRKVQGTKK